MLTVVVVLKALTEVAGFALLGQGVLYLFAGTSRQQNVIYLALRTVTRPVWRAARAITPGRIGDRHVGWIAFGWIALIWLALTAAKIHLVLQARVPA